METLPRDIARHIVPGSLVQVVKENSRVLVRRVECAQGVCFLKRMQRGTLGVEARMNAFLHGFDMGPAVYAYASDEAFDYLLMAGLPGEDGLALGDRDRLPWLLERIAGGMHAPPAYAAGGGLPGAESR